jgi:hypothetical protein
MMMRVCGACGASLPETARRCDRCGHVPVEDRPERAGMGRSGADTAGSLPESSPDRPVGTPGDERGTVADPEHVLWEGGFSSSALAGYWLIAGLLTLTLGCIGLARHGWSHGLFLALVGAVVFGGGVGLYLAYRRLREHATLTNLQFVHQTGLLRRVTERIDVIHIDDVAYWQGTWQRRVGVGSLKIMSGDRAVSELVLHGIRHVADVAARIDRARREERIRRGLFIERPGTSPGADATGECP